MGQIGLFDTANIFERLSKFGDPLERLDKAIKWGIFKKILNKAFAKARKSNAGRPPFDYVMMFKILVLQHLYNLSDAQIQFQIMDRYTFKRFLGLRAEDTIPDEKTVWFFREHLTNAGAVEKLFDQFGKALDAAGFHAQKGMIVDASFVEVPRQRNSREDNETIKSGLKPEGWEEEPAKDRQKDIDARWTKKNNDRHFGYKNHINVDVKNKLIRKQKTTSANVHDSQVFEDLLDPFNSKQSVWADSAYSSQEAEEMLDDLQYKSKVCKKGHRNKPLSGFQVKLNHKKSKIRCRVEHVFGFMANSMNGGFLRCIGFRRAEARNEITNLVYNMSRYVQLLRYA